MLPIRTGAFFCSKLVAALIPMTFSILTNQTLPLFRSIPFSLRNLSSPIRCSFRHKAMNSSYEMRENSISVASLEKSMCCSLS